MLTGWEEEAATKADETEEKHAQAVIRIKETINSETLLLGVENRFVVVRVGRLLLHNQIILPAIVPGYRILEVFSWSREQLIALLVRTVQYYCGVINPP